MDEIHAWDQQAFHTTILTGDDHFGNKIDVEEVAGIQAFPRNLYILFAAFAEAWPPLLNNCFKAA